VEVGDLRDVNVCRGREQCNSSEFTGKNIKNYPRYVECGGHRFRRESAETVPPLSWVHKFKEKAAANLLR
jgi:hypothetical protein